MRQQTTNTAHLEKLINDGMALNELADEFGVSKSSISKWLKADSAPFWTRIACETLEHRKGKDGRQLILCTVPTHTASVVTTIVKSLSGEVVATRVF